MFEIIQTIIGPNGEEKHIYGPNMNMLKAHKRKLEEEKITKFEKDEVFVFTEPLDYSFRCLLKVTSGFEHKGPLRYYPHIDEYLESGLLIDLNARVICPD